MNHSQENLARKKLRILRSQPKEKLLKVDIAIIGVFVIACIIACISFYSLVR